MAPRKSGPDVLALVDLSKRRSIDGYRIGLERMTDAAINHTAPGSSEYAAALRGMRVAQARLELSLSEGSPGEDRNRIVRENTEAMDAYDAAYAQANRDGCLEVDDSAHPRLSIEQIETLLAILESRPRTWGDPLSEIIDELQSSTNAAWAAREQAAEHYQAANGRPQQD